jgi:hypothetical protein
MVSALPQKEKVLESLLIGASYYLVKPINKQIIEELVVRPLE